MKIVFLVNNMGSGGAERTVAYLSEFFARKKHQVEIVSLSKESFYELDPLILHNALNIRSESKNLLDRIINIIKRDVRINQTIKKSQADAVVCILPEIAKYILRLHKKSKFVLITSERNNPQLEGNTDLKKRIFLQSDGIVFQTARAQKWYSDLIQEKGTVIHNAVGNELVKQVSGIVERKKKISAMGRLSEQKDYPTLLKAFSLITKKHPDYTLEVFGIGPDLDKLNKLAVELGISEKVKFMGVHKDAILKVADSSCYVMSSIFEGMPNALMEAMAVGLPCVSTDCPNGPAELIENGVNGLLVPVGDFNALADAILRMIEEKEFAEECGKNAKRILDTHSVDIIAKQYMDYIESVVNKGRR